MWNRRQLRSLAFAAILLVGCDGVSGSERDEFVVKFVESVYEGTEFSNDYIAQSSRLKLNESTPLMTSGFSIDRVDIVGFGGPYEYHLSFSNGAEAVVYVIVSDRQIVQATIDVYPAEK